jgi:iron(III) transport system ATP-binding protein
MAVSVSLRGVTKRFGNTVAVRSVDLEIAQGELFFLLGPSGCGKTTCLRTVAGFYEPDEGELYFGQRPMNSVPPHRRNTGMVFQNYALWPHMTVYENVEYGLTVRRVSASARRKRVSQALEIVQMEGYAGRTANQLSGGQQQRVALARALVIEPDVLLLDEPLSNLDAKLRLEMRMEIKRIHAEVGVTALYVTHDQKEALSLADRLAVMDDGAIVQVGTPREVYTFPASAFVADFIGETNFLHGRVAGTAGGTLRVETAIGIVHAAERDTFADGETVTLSVRPECVLLASEPRGAPNEFRATVRAATYLGNVEEYECVVGDGRVLRAVHHNPGTTDYRPGDAVRVSFQPSDAVALRPPARPSDADGEVVQ